MYVQSVTCPAAPNVRRRLVPPCGHRDPVSAEMISVGYRPRADLGALSVEVSERVDDAEGVFDIRLADVGLEAWAERLHGDAQDGRVPYRAIDNVVVDKVGPRGRSTASRESAARDSSVANGQVAKEALVTCQPRTARPYSPASLCLRYCNFNFFRYFLSVLSGSPPLAANLPSCPVATARLSQICWRLSSAEGRSPASCRAYPPRCLAPPQPQSLGRC